MEDIYEEGKGEKQNMMDKNLIRLLGKDKKYIFIIDLLMLIGLLANVAITISLILILKKAYSMPSFDIRDYKKYIVYFIIALVVRLTMSIAVGYMKDYLGRRIKKSLREKALDKILKLGSREIGELNMAGLTQVSIEGIESLDTYYSQYLPLFIYALIAPLVLFVIGAMIDVRASLALLICVPLIPISIVMVSKRAKKTFGKYFGRYISMGGDFLDNVSGLKELKIFDDDMRAQEKLDKSSEEFRRVTMKVLMMQLSSTTIMDLVAYGGSGLGIAISIFSGYKGYIDWYEVLFFVLVSIEFFLPMRSLGSAFHTAMGGVSAGKKLFTLLNYKEPKWGEDKIENKAITLKDATFSYDGKRNAISGLDMEIKENGITAIAGKSGSGKSTIVKLVMGLHRLNEGSLYVGGKDISSLDRASYYKHLAVVSYNTYIFNDTLRENFRMANPNVSDDMIYEALDKVNLKSFVINNGGLDKIIREDSVNISGGERQRLALAINLVSGKDIFIFDEATSNIDSDSEAIIINTIKELSKTSTVILISHRLKNLRVAESIYYLDNGSLAEKGSFDELINAGKDFAKLYNTQIALENGYKEVA